MEQGDTYDEVSYDYEGQGPPHGEHTVMIDLAKLFYDTLQEVPWYPMKKKTTNVRKREPLGEPRIQLVEDEDEEISTTTTTSIGYGHREERERDDVDGCLWLLMMLLLNLLKQIFCRERDILPRYNKQKSN